MQFRAIFYYMQLILYAAMGTITNPCLALASVTNGQFLFLGYALTA